MEVEDVHFEVAEMDVYLTHNLEDELAVLQHPLRPPWRSEDPGLLQAIRYKPNAEMDYSLPTEDLQRAASSCPDGMAPIEHFAVRSSRVPLQTNYAIAVFKGNSLHLTPVQNMYQMRPDFSALDERDKMKEKRKEEAKLQRLKAEGKAPSDAGVTLKPAQVHFVQQESERSKWIREHSWSYLKALEDEEPFVNLGLVGREDALDGEHFEKLFYQDEMTAEDIPWNLSGQMYLSAINPQTPVVEELDSEGRKKEREYSLHQIRQMPLAMKVFHIVKKIHITQFYTLFPLLGVDESQDAEVLKHLMTVAVIVRGVFIFKTSRTPLSAYEQALRNYVLLKFVEDGKVSAEDILNEFGVQPKFLHSIVQPFGTCTNGVWTLKVPNDDRFLANKGFERAIVGAKKGWAKGKSMITEELKKASKEGSKPRSELEVQMQIQLQQYNIELPDNTDAKEAILFLFKTLQHYGVVSPSLVATRLKVELATGKHFSNPTRINLKMVTGHLPSLATQIHGVWCLKSSGHPEIDPYRDVILTLFKETLSLNKQQIDQGCLRTLGKSIPSNVYEKIMRELSYRPHGKNNWILKSGNLSTESS